MQVFQELKQRKVLQTAAIYFAGAWGATEVLSYLIERIPIFPAWADTVIAILFVLGFPVAIFLSWMFDVGRDGVRRADPASGVGKGVIILSVAGLLVATAGLSYLIWPRVQAEHGVMSGDLGTVAVLPFENLTGDPSRGYLGAALSEDIRQRLAMFTDLKVIGRVSMAGFAMGGTDLASVRGLLGAGLVVEGSLQNPGGRLRVNIALLDTRSGRQVWSNSFDIKETGWEPLRQRIVTSLGEQLSVTVRLKEQAALVPDEALEAYFRALSELSEPELADGWFEEAVRLAPDFADAWARRALLRLDMIWRGLPRTQAWEEGEEFIANARALEPENLMADVAEAHLLWWAKLDPATSVSVLRRAESQAPNDPLVLAGLGTALRYVGAAEEAEIYHRRYLAQDPLNPEAHTRLAATLFFIDRWEEAIATVDRALELDPSFLLAWEYKANMQNFSQRPADALVTLTLRGQAEGRPGKVTQQCMLSIAALLLPLERAVPLLEDGIRRGIGMMKSHAWCLSAMQTLQIVYANASREGEAEAAGERWAQWARQSGAEGQGVMDVLVNQTSASNCKTELCRIEQSLGEEEMAKWLGPDPPVQSGFDLHLAASLAEALMEAGREDEARRLAGIVVPVFAVDHGQMISHHVVLLLVVSGDIEGAIEYAELYGPNEFENYGWSLRHQIRHPELENNPRWQAFLDACDRRREEEIEKFDRLVASGKIVMP